MTYRKGKQIPFCCYMPPEMVEALRKVSKKTHVPVAALIRLGVEKVLKCKKR